MSEISLREAMEYAGMDEKTRAIYQLKTFQKQLDPEGIEVGVSRQALDEVITDYQKLQQENAELKENRYKLQRALRKAADERDEEQAENSRLRELLSEITTFIDNEGPAAKEWKAITAWTERTKAALKGDNDDTGN